MPNKNYYKEHLEESRARGRKYYHTHREKELLLRNEFNHSDRGKELRDKKKLERKTLLDNYKAEHGCVICGEKDPVVLDFHHIDPTIKGYTISQIRQTGSIKLIMSEVAKCVVVCRNDHARIHAGTITLNAHEV